MIQCQIDFLNRLSNKQAANTANTPFHTRIHTFNIVSLLLALMADLCLPLCAGEDTFELHSVQLEASGETDPRAAWETGPAEEMESNAGNISG